MKPRVFILEPIPKRLNIAPAKRFGDMVTLFKAADCITLIDSDWQADLMQRLGRWRYDPQHDYFLVAGNMVNITVATTRIIAKYGLVNLLLYDADMAKYVSQVVSSPIPLPDKVQT